MSIKHSQVVLAGLVLAGLVLAGLVSGHTGPDRFRRSMFGVWVGPPPSGLDGWLALRERGVSEVVVLSNEGGAGLNTAWFLGMREGRELGTNVFIYDSRPSLRASVGLWFWALERRVKW